MVLGLAILLDVVSAESRRERLDTGAPRFTWTTRTPVLVLALVAVVGAALPALGARLAPTQGVAETPGYWVQAAEWLDEQPGNGARSEEHTSELQSLMRISYAVFCLQKKKDRHIARTAPRHS